jgi:hypothetical protein
MAPWRLAQLQPEIAWLVHPHLKMPQVLESDIDSKRPWSFRRPWAPEMTNRLGGDEKLVQMPTPSLSPQQHQSVEDKNKDVKTMNSSSSTATSIKSQISGRDLALDDHELVVRETSSRSPSPSSECDGRDYGSPSPRSEKRQAPEDANSDTNAQRKRKTDPKRKKQRHRTSKLEGGGSVPSAFKTQERTALGPDTSASATTTRIDAPQRALGVDTRPSFFGSDDRILEGRESIQAGDATLPDSIDSSRSHLVHDFVLSLLARGPLCGSITTTTSAKVLKLQDLSASSKGLQSLLIPRHDCSRVAQDLPEPHAVASPLPATAVPPMYQPRASWNAFAEMSTLPRERERDWEKLRAVPSISPSCICLCLFQRHPPCDGGQSRPRTRFISCHHSLVFRHDFPCRLLGC